MATVNARDLLPDGQVLYFDPEGRAVFALMATPGAEDEKSIRHRAHAFAAALADGARFDGMHVVETWQVPPGGQDFHGHSLPAGAWVMGLKFDDDAWPRIRTQLDSGDAATKRGEPMDRDKVFADAVRGTVPPTGEATDADLILIQQTLNAALLPLLFQVRDLDSRIRRVVTGIMPPPENDPFGAAVRRPDQLTRAEEAAAAKRLERDPFGRAVLDKRPALVKRPIDRLLERKRS